MQVTETDDEDLPHLITDIAGSGRNQTDFEALAGIQERLMTCHCQPGKQYADRGYISGPNLILSAKNGIELIGPSYTVVSKQSKIADEITTDQFLIDTEKQTATCPTGVPGHLDHGWKGKLRFHFPDDVCAACRLRPRCCAGRKGRTICVGLGYTLLQKVREQQQTQAFKEDYHKHRSGVEGCLSALVRGNGMRSSVLHHGSETSPAGSVYGSRSRPRPNRQVVSGKTSEKISLLLGSYLTTSCCLKNSSPNEKWNLFLLLRVCQQYLW